MDKLLRKQIEERIRSKIVSHLISEIGSRKLKKILNDEDIVNKIGNFISNLNNNEGTETETQVETVPVVKPAEQELQAKSAPAKSPAVIGKAKVYQGSKMVEREITIGGGNNQSVYQSNIYHFRMH